MRYLLSCTCGEDIPVSKAQAGTVATCPKCRATIEVPTIRSLSKLPQQEAGVQVQSGKKNTGSASSRLSWVAALFAGICFLTFAVTGFLGGALAWERLYYEDELNLSQIEAWTVEQEVEYGDKMVAAYSSSDLFDVWEEYKTLGLSDKQPPQHFVLKNQIDKSRNRMYSFLTVAGIAAAGFGLSLLLGRKRRQT